MEEEINARDHFINECGWSEEQFNDIKSYPYFCAKVSAWQDGMEVGSEYLSCCCYERVEDFYTTHAGDYFRDMVVTLLTYLSGLEHVEQVKHLLKNNKGE